MFSPTHLALNHIESESMNRKALNVRSTQESFYITSLKDIAITWFAMPEDWMANSSPAS